jgi:hypothetical protein
VITQQADCIFILALQPDNIIDNFSAVFTAINVITDEDQRVILSVDINPGHQIFKLFQTAVNISYGIDFIHEILPDFITI